MITQPRYRLADRLIDPSQCTILKDDTLLKVELRAMQVLVCLIKHAGEPVSRDMLLEEVWSGGEVSDNAINRIIGLLRNQLGDNAKSPSFIKTLPKVGYVLIAEVAFVKAISKEEVFTEEVIAGSNIDDREVTVVKSLKRSLFSFVYKHPSKCVLFFLGLAFFSLWLGGRYFFSDSFNPPLQYTTELTRLTFLNGQEFTPALSPDGNLLAFSQRNFGEKNWKIAIKSLETGTIDYLKEVQDSQGYPAFSPDGSMLAYLSFNQSGGCKINVVKISDGKFDGIKTITRCKKQMQATSIAWKPSGKSIFYVDEDHYLDYLSEKKVFSISLNGSNKQQISQPFSIGRGDYAISISPNGRYLAVIRNVGWYNAQLMLLSLETGDWQKLFSVDFLPHTVAWARDSKSLIYRGKTGHLTRYDIDSQLNAQMTQIMQPIISPTSNAVGDVVAVIGDLYNSEIWKVSGTLYNKEGAYLSKHTNTTSKFISSNRKDRNGMITPNGKEMVFVSERTGLPQLWIKKNNGNEVQLTYFKSLSFIRDISLSNDGVNVLGRINSKPFIFNIHESSIKYVDVKNFEDIYGVSWGRDNKSIVVSVDNLGLSKLKLVSVDTGEVITTLVEGGEFGKYSNSGQFYFTKRLSEGLWTFVNGVEKLVDAKFNGMSNVSWFCINGYVYNLAYVDGSYYLERINVDNYKKQLITLPFDELIGDSISVDESGNAYVVISKPSNVDVIKVNY